MTFEELCKILTSDVPSELLKANREQLFELIPELRTCENFNQHSAWHTHDVLEHIYHVIDATDNVLELRIAALFHDIGKPSTYSPEIKDGKEIGHFPKHWEKSNKMFKHFLRVNGIRMPNRKLVSKLIINHDFRFSIDKSNDELIDKLTELFDIDEIKMLYNLRKADLNDQIIQPGWILDYDGELNQILNRYGSKVI